MGIANAVYAAVVRFLNNPILLALLAAFGVALVVSSSRLGTLDAGWEYDAVPLALSRVFYSFFAGILLCRVHHGERKLGFWVLALISILCVADLLIPQAPTLTAETICVLAALPAITFACSCVDVRGSVAKLCGFLGILSYAVYVIHEPAGHIFRLIEIEFLGEMHPGLGFVFLGLLIAGCWLLDRIYDRPARAFLRDRLAAPRRKVALAGALER